MNPKYHHLDFHGTADVQDDVALVRNVWVDSETSATPPNPSGPSYSMRKKRKNGGPSHPNATHNQRFEQSPKQYENSCRNQDQDSSGSWHISRDRKSSSYYRSRSSRHHRTSSHRRGRSSSRCSRSRDSSHHRSRSSSHRRSKRRSSSHSRSRNSSHCRSSSHCSSSSHHSSSHYSSGPSQIQHPQGPPHLTNPPTPQVNPETLDYRPFFEAMSKILAETLSINKQILGAIERMGQMGRGQLKQAASLPEGFTFPLQDVEELERLNTVLQKDEPRLRMVQFVRNYGGSSPEACLKGVMKRLMRASLSIKYNQTGRKQKRSFNLLSALKGSLYDGIRERFPSVTTVILDKLLQKWLTGSIDRDGLKLKREEERQQRTAMLPPPSMPSS